MKIYKMLKEMKEWAVLPISSFYMGIAVWFPRPIFSQVGAVILITFSFWLIRKHLYD